MAEQEEIEEHIHHAHEPFDKAVAGTMAGIAAFLAIVSVLGQHFNTEKLLNQQLSSDQWAFYQAKNIRRYSAQMAQDVLSQLKAPPEAIAKYVADGKKYDTQMAEIQDKARDYAKESDKTGHQADRFHLGEVFLEIAIVLSSLAILTKRRPIFIAGAGSAIAGLAIAATAYWA
jgi:uncharacterized protein DUF4337